MKPGMERNNWRNVSVPICEIRTKPIPGILSKIIYTNPEFRAKVRPWDIAAVRT